MKALSSFFKWLGKANSEDNGNPSNTRFNVSYAVIILIPCIAFTLLYVVFEYKDLIEATLISILTFLTGLYGIKVFQKGKETTVENGKGKTENGGTGVQ